MKDELQKFLDQLEVAMADPAQGFTYDRDGSWYTAHCGKNGTKITFIPLHSKGGSNLWIKREGFERQFYLIPEHTVQKFIQLCKAHEEDDRYNAQLDTLKHALDI